MKIYKRATKGIVMRLNAKRVMAVGGASVDNDLCMPTAKEQDEAVGVTTIQILFIDAAINQVDSPQCENKLRLVRLSLPLRRMFLQKVATFTLHDPNSDCFATGFCEARCSLRSGNAPQKLVSRVAVGRARASIIGVYQPFLLPEQ